MRRRTLLASLGGGIAGLASIAGCLDSGGPGSGTGSETPTGEPTPADGTPRSPTRDPTTADGPTTTDGSTPTDDHTPTADPASTDVTVESVVLQYGIVTPSSPDSIGLSYVDTPYLVASVRVDGPLPRSAFALSIGDDELQPANPDRFYRTEWGAGHWYSQDVPDGLVLFELPTGDPDGSVELTWPGGHRTIDESIGGRLAAGPPSFSVSLSVPETHDEVSAPPVEIEVTNEDDVPRQFLGALNRIGPLIAYAPIARLSELVPAGESHAMTYRDDWTGMPDDEHIGDGDHDVTYRLHYAGGDATGKIELVESA